MKEHFDMLLFAGTAAGLLLPLCIILCLNMHKSTAFVSASRLVKRPFFSASSRLYSATTTETTVNMGDVELLKKYCNETSRGQKISNQVVKDNLNIIVANLEAKNTFDRSKLIGTWELLYAEDDITRASPFFWAFQKSTKSIKAPVKLGASDEISDSIFLLTDSLPFRSIGECIQTIKEEPTSDDEEKTASSSLSLVSKVRINVEVNGLNLATSLMTTTSRLLMPSSSSSSSNIVEIQVSTTEVLA